VVLHQNTLGPLGVNIEIVFIKIYNLNLLCVYIFKYYYFLIFHVYVLNIIFILNYLKKIPILYFDLCFKDKS
jgi:hypothetical protein